MARSIPHIPHNIRRWLAGKYRETPLALAELRTKVGRQSVDSRPNGVILTPVVHF